MKPRTIRRWVTAAFFVGGVLAAQARAHAAPAVPQTITNQGRLFDAQSQPINATLKVLFSIYDAPDAKTPIWSEEHDGTFDEGY